MTDHRLFAGLFVFKGLNCCISRSCFFSHKFGISPTPVLPPAKKKHISQGQGHDVYIFAQSFGIFSTPRLKKHTPKLCGMWDGQKLFCNAITRKPWPYQVGWMPYSSKIKTSQHRDSSHLALVFHRHGLVPFVAHLRGLVVTLIEGQPTYRLSRKFWEFFLQLLRHPLPRHA